tara:strand:- start:286 stop:462 length:177 start_codon:yes stop_codon:yes gene_type:complete
MNYLFAVSLGLSPIEIAAISISTIGFIAMFGIASAKGDFQGLIKTTLENDATNRNARK